MGTNYYIRNNICKCCDRSDEEHIGKSSGGRDFTIRHHRDEYNSWAEFQEYIKDKRIFDEYGEEITSKEMIAFIEEKAEKEGKVHKGLNDSHGIYIDGFYFLDSDFC